MLLNYIDYNTLIKDSFNLSKEIKRKYDIVIGIPRSGYIPASIIGFNLGLPIVTPYEFIVKRTFKFGVKFRDVKNILLVDDSITSGNTIKKAILDISEQGIFNIDTAIIYTDLDNKHDITYVSKTILAPRIFQWNVFNHGHLKTACLDFDGVLCKEQTFVEDDNKPDQMQEFILNAEPLYIPKKPIYAIVSNRIELYRKECEAWLKKHNVRYEHLILTPFKSADQRRKYLSQLGGNGYWKAKRFKELEAKWFIESDIIQSKQIRSVINSSVFCTDTMQMI